MFQQFKIRRILYILTFLILTVSFLQTVKSQVNVTIAFDSTAILIGDQIKFNITVDQPRDAKVTLPALQDTLIKEIEILNAFPADTTLLSAQTIRVTKRFLITSFDSGDYKIDFLKFPYFEKGRTDTAYSNVTMLYVRSIPIKDPNKIADIKGVIEIPLTFKEILPYVAFGLGGLLLLAFIAYAYYRWKNKKSVFGFAEKPADPAHVIAFRELEKLKSEKLWQQGFTKQYYSRLTDIIREYIENRFSILAMESTSDEIIVALKDHPLMDNKLKSDLKEMLSQADLVKFAKAEPLPNENEQSWQFANDFVVHTFRDKIEEPADIENSIDEKGNVE